MKLKQQLPNMVKCQYKDFSLITESNCTKATGDDGITGCCMLNREMVNGKIYGNCSLNKTLNEYTCPFDRFGKRFGICRK